MCSLFHMTNLIVLSFFGDEVDSIRTFDVETQLSTERIKKVSIIPNVANKAIAEKRESFLKYISNKTVVFTKKRTAFTF